MKNVNRFLESPWRTELSGLNLASSGTKLATRYPDIRWGTATPRALWDDPQPGMHGILTIGHHTDIYDPLCVNVTADGKAIHWNPMRNRWTPAYMDTIYRSDIDPDYYPYSGTLVMRERKAISRNDFYISHLTITNEKRESSHISVEITMPFVEENGVYNVSATITAGALGRTYPVTGYAVVLTDRGGRTAEFDIPPFSSVSLRYAMAYDPDSPADASYIAESALQLTDPFTDNENTFNKWFEENVPVLETENSDLLKIYYYRWFVVYKSIHEPSRWIKDHQIPGPCMYESPLGRWFGTVVGLSLPLQIAEAKWMKNTQLVENQIRNWCNKCPNHQAYIQFTPWVVWHFYTLHRNKEWLQQYYPYFTAYAQRILDRPIPFPTTGSWVTGAEYQPSFYQYTEGQPWDWRFDNEGKKLGFPVKSVYRLDSLVYEILTLRGCANMARELGLADEEACFNENAEIITTFIKQEMWDDGKKFFFDVDCDTGRRCDEAPCYDSFAPFIVGIDSENYRKAFDRLWDPEWFRSDFMVPSVAKNCPMFWYDNCNTGPTEASLINPHDYGCSWNGPVWPYANTLVLTGLGCSAMTDKELQKQWLSLFDAHTQLHFPYGDRGTPVICEQYRCDDGASFSPYNDYFHSNWIDLFMTYYAGIRVDDGNIRFAPFAREAFNLRNVSICGKVYDFSLDESGNATIISK